MKKLLFTLSRKRILTLLLLAIFIIGCSEDEPELPQPESTDPETEDPNTDPEDRRSCHHYSRFYKRMYGGSEDDTFHDVTSHQRWWFYRIRVFSKYRWRYYRQFTTQVNMYWLVKTDSAGNIQWSKTYGGTNDDRGEEVIQTSDGGYAMIGYSRSSDGDVSAIMKVFKIIGL